MTSPNKAISAKFTPANSSKNKKNLLARLFIVLLFTLFLGLIAAPAAIKIGLQQWLSEQTKTKVTVAEVRLNIFSGKLFLRQLHIPPQNRSEQASSLEYASITIDMKALIQQQIVVSEITLSHANITIEQTSDQLRIAGIPIPIPPPVDSTVEPTPDTNASNPLAVTVHTIKLESVALHYRNDEINSKIVIDSKIKNIKTAAPNEAIHLALSLNIDKGEIRYQGELHPFAATPAFNGELTIDKLNLAAFASFVPQSDFIIKQLTLNHQSNINGALPHDGAPQFNLTGSTSLNNIDIVATLNNDTYLKTTAITINHIEVQYPATISMGDIVISDLDASLLKDSEGNLLTKAQPTGDNIPTTSSNTAAQEEQDSTLVFSINSLLIEGNSALAFSDASVSPQFNIKLAPLSLSLGRIHSANPTAETPLSLSASINETGSTKLTGHISPLADELTIKLNNTLTEFELPLISPYTEQAIGYQLRRGRLSAETALEIKGDQLQVINKLTLTKLSIKESDAEKAQGLIEQLEMPLDSALDLLRDGDDNIVFELPVHGSLNDPQFKLGGVMKLAIGKGMKMAAMRYLTNALQPLGTLLLAKNIIGIIAKPRFKPLSFAAGRSELNTDTRAYLDKLGELLINRPKLTISLCGIANQDDQALFSSTEQQAEKTDLTPATPKEQLHALATARAENASTHLRQQGIGNNQLFACNPEISPEHGDSISIVEGVDISL
ncbi:MAG: hypothetical protein COB71_11580 [Thiotrichales bacterium]|nr:MAG: hypothetical protein COB71_12575 [Thiotrichales bacterium]PCI11267.1 MAG: hypothetical protein COB71_11580 [Thiotrichales bacterium]